MTDHDTKKVEKYGMLFEIIGDIASTQEYDFSIDGFDQPEANTIYFRQDNLEKYSDLLKKIKYKSITFDYTAVAQKRINIDFNYFSNLSNVSAIRIFTPNQLEFNFPQKGLDVFEKLETLVIRGPVINFPSPTKFPSLKTIIIEFFNDYFDDWNYSCINDLTIYNLKKADLCDLYSAKAVERLTLVQGNQVSLSGIESFSNLKTLYVASAKKMTDISKVIECDKLINLKFEKCRHLKNWSILRSMPNLEAIDIDVANDISFLEHLDRIKYFRCGKIIDGNSSFLSKRASIDSSPIYPAFY